ncbi:transcription-repair coupling factor [Cephaloticoccus primus]|uniref:Transcription-repair-coupling factor n=1 Tax=Cephaloticoccus primus TaxID=1548207 RepID=A0A139SPP1_9BACT|nr:transcription-repair coupling factor [Cephaloticoccus primus]KXU36492.1 transcription-repair coupling factor [Cephaloticoccus primus]
MSAQPPNTDFCALTLSGICPPARGLALAELIRQHPQVPLWLVLAPDAKTAAPLAEDIVFFHSLLLETGSGPAPRKTKTSRPKSPRADADQPTSSAEQQPERISGALFPEAMPDSRDMREAFAASSERLAILGQLRALREHPSGEGRAPLAVVTTPAALLQPVPALEALAAQEITLRRGQQQPFAALLEQLQVLDYDCEALCEAPGHYAVRGGIVDLYPVTATQPYRIDFFGDEIESIRLLDPVTQRSGSSVDAITLSATPRIQLDPARSGLADYLPQGSALVFVEPAELEDELRTATANTRDGAQGSDQNDSNELLPETALAPLRAKAALQICLCEIEQSTSLTAALEAAPHGDASSSAAPPARAAPRVQSIEWQSEPLALHRRLPSEALLAHERLQAEADTRRDFLQQLLRWQREGLSLHFVASKEGEAQRMAEILEEEGLGETLRPHIHIGSLNEGFRFCAQARGAPPVVAGHAGSTETAPAHARTLIIVTETELFGRQRTRRPQQAARQVAQRSQIDQLLDFSELAEGDYVVHLQHGIAQFRGLATLDTAQGPREVISLEFDEQVTLHVPLQESHLISRYVGLTKVRPQLGKVGSGRWEKTRKAAERATIDLAAELLRIQAAREAQPGFACPEDTNWQKEFEASFPYTETRDQLRAIEDTKADMERRRPMDRLVCGDVGFGKTEVAIRAAFKAVQGGRQVALLVPTTVLAQQHLNTFRERMAGYPIVVEMLSRFRSRKEQQSILAATAAGQVDILIGTHRLLQSDVVFKELGLLIVDEEQRFGVKHKERFKALRATLDVLSMSATPIPRTLYMALTGARDLSVIETPPADRHPIQTIVKTYDEKLVAEAIRHELRRGGQVFYLHNRVQTIDLVAARLRELVPDTRVGIGHGKMEPTELERVMTDFVAGKYQVLVCTTIIESGLDIPNCNTIIIESADRFGLSQLYQLRGRVGRFKHQAYAYLLLHRHTRLLDIARQRLGAMRQHNQLGAGFRIAMRDLELRGAGNLLGSQQSGHIVGVGFELYCQLLRQSVARLKGEKTAANIRASVKLDFVQVGDGSEAGKAGHDGRPTSRPQNKGHFVSGYTALRDAEQAEALPPIRACLPASYIAETRLRIDFYRRLALAQSTGQLKEIAAELRDRFGKFGEPVKALFALTEVRIHAEQKGLSSVETDAARLKCLRASGRPDDWVRIGARFPRLTAPSPLLRLREILTFLKNLPDPPSP